MATGHGSKSKGADMTLQEILERMRKTALIIILFQMKSSEKTLMIIILLNGNRYIIMILREP